MFKSYIILFTVLSVVSAGSADWYKTGIFYQVYPRSFMDSNNDGIGDLQGIYDKLDHIKDAGITGAWLSPIFKSPQVDQGYDISDYYTIDSDYGNLYDLTQIIEKAHKLGLKIILDFVPNHTSNQHYWFEKSVNKVPGYEDYYVWADQRQGANGTRLPPNNWISVFSNSAWEWNDERQQYYLHQFTTKQPDLNFRNPKVVEELKHILTFYLNLGIDGFRVDAVPYLFEDKGLRDEPLSGTADVSSNDWNYLNHIYTKDINDTFDMIYEFRSFIDNYTTAYGGDARILMTEAYADFDKTLLYYGDHNATVGRLGAHFTFNFEFVSNVNSATTATEIKEIVDRWIGTLNPAYPQNWLVGNHDNPRAATKLGNVDGYNMLIAFLPGIAVTYNGEEIGQENGYVSCEEGMDPNAITNCTSFPWKSRDFERTPFQWDNSTNAGFNKGAKPWLPVSEQYRKINLDAQNVPGLRSHYNIYKDSLSLHKNISDLDEISIDNSSATKNVLNIKRWKSGSSQNNLHVLLVNLDKEQSNIVPLENGTGFELLISSNNSQKTNGDIFFTSIILLPKESLILKQLQDENVITMSTLTTTSLASYMKIGLIQGILNLTALYLITNLF